MYQRLLSERQGSQIMVGLRLYKNNTGHWPENLDDIKPFLPSDDILIEPQNNGSFNYKRNNDSYSLNTDQGWLIWPLQVTIQNTNTQQTDPNE